MKKIVHFIAEHSVLFIIAAINFVIVYASSWNGRYGYFIDEFYYIACSAKPAFGYVDHPPLAPLILTLVSLLFGTSLAVIRLVPALAGGATIVMTGVIAKESGGGRLAQSIAASGMALSPMAAAFAGFYSMNIFEPLLAIILLYSIIRMIKEDNPRRWIGAGIVMGLGIINKHSFGVFIIALFISLLLSGKWKFFMNRWFVIASACGFIVVLPNILWETTHQFATLEFYKNIGADKNVYTPPKAFIVGQLIGMSVTAAPLWMTGLFYGLFSRRQKLYRFLPILFACLFLFMMLTGTSRSDRMIFAYPAVFASGGIAVERFIERFRLRWMPWAVFPFFALGFVVSLPLILPYFGYEDVRSYVNYLGLNTEIERGKKPPLPQLLADRIGWKEKFSMVKRSYDRLTPDEQRRTIISAGNYGQAGAIELFGKEYAFPPVVCGHNTYYLWSKERLTGDIVLVLTSSSDYGALASRFEEVEFTPEEYSSPYVSSHENHLTVFICRKPKRALSELLDESKIYH